MTTDNFCFYLKNRLIQTSQTGGQQYSDTSPFSIPWIKGSNPATGAKREKMYRKVIKEALIKMSSKRVEMAAVENETAFTTYCDIDLFCPGFDLEG